MKNDVFYEDKKLHVAHIYSMKRKSYRKELIFKFTWNQKKKTVYLQIVFKASV